MKKYTTPVTAVFDIGRTNKKFLLFDENFEAVYQKYSKLEEAETLDDDGYSCEDLVYLVNWNYLANWIKDRLQNGKTVKATYKVNFVQLCLNGRSEDSIWV